MSGELLFVYGTLRGATKQAKAVRLARESTYLGTGFVRGRLLFVAHYPGLVPGHDCVHGDLLRLHDGPATWGWLDAHEGADFLRVRCRVTMQEGGTRRAWCYRYIGPARGLPVIESGDYLQSR